ncbi:MAG: hypothetical protein H0X66_12090 [Verrucomicrobia bacterium]|nr:hypothetical protein [Verrucomicrobiota bacterium]
MNLRQNGDGTFWYGVLGASVIDFGLSFEASTTELELLIPYAKLLVAPGSTPMPLIAPSL